VCGCLTKYTDFGSLTPNNPYSLSVVEEI